MTAPPRIVPEWVESLTWSPSGTVFAGWAHIGRTCWDGTRSAQGLAACFSCRDWWHDLRPTQLTKREPIASPDGAAFVLLTYQHAEHSKQLLMREADFLRVIGGAQ